MTKHSFESALLLFTMLVLPCFSVLAQEEGKVITISETVGNVIDSEERNAYKLFPGVLGFQKAVLLELPDKQYVWEITYLNETTGEVKIKRLVTTEESIESITKRIDPFPAVTGYKTADSTAIQRLTMNDGSVFVGRVLSTKNQEILFELGRKRGGSVVTVDKNDIREIETLSESSFHDGEYWFPNPNSTRLFFAPTARTLKQGEGYFQDVGLLVVGGAVGLSDNITIGGGLSIVPGARLDEQLLFLTPKIGGPVAPKLNIGTGALLVRVGGETAGIVYGVGTMGDENASLTAGLGYGFVNSNLADTPMFMVGGEKRLSKRVSMVSENWNIPGADFIISYGFRFMGEKLAVDLAWINTLDFDFNIGIPYIDFVYTN